MSHPDSIPNPLATTFEDARLSEELRLHMEIVSETSSIFDDAAKSDVTISGAKFKFPHREEEVSINHESATVTTQCAKHEVNGQTFYMRLLKFPVGGDYGDDFFLIADQTPDVQPITRLISAIKIEVGDDGLIPGLYLNNAMADASSAADILKIIQAIGTKDSEAKAAVVAAAKATLAANAAKLEQDAQTLRDLAAARAAARKSRNRDRRVLGYKIGGSLVAISLIAGGITEIASNYCGNDCTIGRIDAHAPDLTDGSIIAVGKDGTPQYTYQAEQVPGMLIAKVPEVGDVDSQAFGPKVGHGTTDDDRIVLDHPRQIVLDKDDPNTKDKLYCERIYISRPNPKANVRVATDNPQAGAISVRVRSNFIDVCEPPNFNHTSGKMGRVILQYTTDPAPTR